ncbi:MAG: DUF4391 domain-containing protein [Pseudomonadota bacterium]|nr:DUF4391 domain-containing protein [Pseudomonadota bacterium]
MVQTFLNVLGIPEKCYLNKTLFKKLFQENADLDITDKKALKDDIDKIRWLYTLKPSTVNIEPFKDAEREYDEVAILQIDLTNATRMKRISSFVHKAIPYPIIIIFTHGDDIALSVADKRINQADKTKWVVEEGWLTEWFNPSKPNKVQQQFMAGLSLKNLSFVNFYAFYTDVKNLVISLNAAEQTGSYNVTKGSDAQSRIEKLRELEKLEQEKSELQNKLKKEKQMGRQVDLTTHIKKIADQINGLKQEL